MDSLPATPGSTVEFEIRVRNEDPEVPICALRFDDTLTGPFEPCAPPPIMPPYCIAQLLNGAGNPMCTVPPSCYRPGSTQCEVNLVQACGVLMNPTDELVIRCAGTIPEDPVGDTITNEVEVTCAPDDGENCVDGPIFCGDPKTASAEVQVKDCDFTVEKQVRCEGEDDAAWRDSAEALPGSNVEFRIQVCNNGFHFINADI